MTNIFPSSEIVIIRFLSNVYLIYNEKTFDYVRPFTFIFNCLRNFIDNVICLYLDLVQKCFEKLERFSVVQLKTFIIRVRLR